MRPEHDTSCPATGVGTQHCSSVTVTRPPAGLPRDAGWSTKAHLGHLLLVQVEHLPGAGGSDLFVSQVARVGAVATVPSQHEDHLEERGDMQPGSWLPQPPVSVRGSGRDETQEEGRRQPRSSRQAQVTDL